MLKGLGYVKGQDAPIAKEDSEYPAWLWGLLSEKRGKVEAKEGEEGEEGDFYCASPSHPIPSENPVDSTRLTTPHSQIQKTAPPRQQARRSARLLRRARPRAPEGPARAPVDRFAGWRRDGGGGDPGGGGEGGGEGRVEEGEAEGD